MKPPQEHVVAESKSCLYALFPASFLIGLILFFTISISSQGSNQRLLQRLQILPSEGTEKPKVEEIDQCKNQCRPRGSEALPAGIVSNTSSFEMKHLWEIPKKEHSHAVDVKANATTNLLAMAVGIKQKDLVDKMVQKFIASNFMVMLFHYDGIVDEWKDFKWSNHVIHVAAINQGKWWFAKRFLHPDIVAEYDYIFLWDEDLGVENFNPDKYVSIIKHEGLEISQPALDPQKSVVHHQITARGRRSTVHRRTYKPGHGGKGCDKSSTAPPCTGWIEMMAPVFSRPAWRCVWYMIQSDLVHAWGLDMQLGYCAQGDRTKKVGVVDAEYIVHHNLPTLGGIDKTKVTSKEKDHRGDVRRLSHWELEVFRKRWEKAAEEDKCWVDPYQ
ncbi:hypothetical protein TanjilG_15486 [Lupinus angustifolius]|uniref:uncharacterized protein LOC109336073 isoform X1 n=2 Tax=Lupinus angustifolius TaxID=3871 RepID=UPI00090D4721|nr:PREDICTED: uncharacterized protein LOC109336073 isoform X1 [Lupinus angustifolius]OIV90753.1 hypothetical protein TanjilG_15486 [Lupinus angustifolius]